MTRRRLLKFAGAVGIVLAAEKATPGVALASDRPEQVAAVPEGIVEAVRE